MATSKKQKKQSNSVIDIANRWLDRNFRNAVNKSTSDLNKKIQKKLDPVRKEVKKVNTEIQTKVGDPIRKTVYGDKKKDVKKVETKKVVAKKPEVKKPTAKPISMKTPVRVSDIANKVAEGARKKDAPKVKAQIESLKRPEIKKKKELQPEIKRYKPNTEPLRYLDDKLPIKNSESKKSTPTPPPPSFSPTVSQLWQQKTGTSWSEAKKQGLTDGSASANMALMKKLKSGSVNKESIKVPKPGTAASMDTFKKEMEKNVQSELSGETTYEPPVSAMRRGGSIKKMRKGGITKRRK